MRNVCVIKVTVCLLVSTEALLYVFGRRQTACCNVSEGNSHTFVMFFEHLFAFSLSNSNEKRKKKKEDALKPPLLFFSCLIVLKLFTGKYCFCRGDVQAYTTELKNSPCCRCAIPLKMLVEVYLSGDLTQ